MSTTVEITLGDDGKISVGLSDGPSSSAGDMQPAKSLGDALAMARHLLSQSASDAMGQGSGSDRPSPVAGASAPGGPSGTQSGNGTGGGTGPDTDGSVVQDDTQGGKGGGQDAQALWDALAQVNMPQN